MKSPIPSFDIVSLFNPIKSQEIWLDSKKMPKIHFMGGGIKLVVGPYKQYAVFQYPSLINTVAVKIFLLYYQGDWRQNMLIFFGII
jgi:hypothetical protein